MRGSFGGEWNLDGFVGCLMKKPYQESLEQLFKALEQDIPAEQMKEGAQGAIPVETVDNKSAASQAMIFSVLSLVLCWIPIAAIIFGCLGYSRARLGLGSSKAEQAKLGRIFSIIGITLGAVIWRNH